MDTYLLHSIELPDTRKFFQFQNHSVSPQIDTILSAGSGNAHPQNAYLTRSRTNLTYTTPQLKSVIQSIGSTFFFFDSANVDLFWRKKKQLGDLEATGVANSVHQRLRGTIGMLWWESFNAAQNGVASAACQMRFLSSDGIASPLAWSGTEDILNPTVCDEQFTLGPLTVNGVTLQGLQSVTINSGIVLAEHGDSGSFYDTHLSIDQYRYQIVATSFEGTTWDAATEVGHDGQPLTGGGVTGYFRAYEDLSKIAVDASVVHIKYTVDGAAVGDGIVRITDTSGANDQKVQSQITIDVVSAAPDVPGLVFAVDQAIT